MKKITRGLLMLCLLFLFGAAAAGCAQTGSDTMSGSSMETQMDTSNMDTGNDSMDSNMNKSMGSMDAEKMDTGMGETMQKEMK